MPAQWPRWLVAGRYGATGAFLIGLALWAWAAPGPRNTRATPPPPPASAPAQPAAEAPATRPACPAWVRCGPADKPDGL